MKETKTPTTIEIRESIDANLSQMGMKIQLIKKKNPTPGVMTLPEYIWITFAGNIYYQAKDLVILLDDHAGKTVKLKAPLYTLLRGILEDLFYFRLIFVDKKSIPLHWNAFLCADQEKGKAHLVALDKLEKKGKFIASDNPGSVTSLPGLSKKISELEAEAQSLRDKAVDIDQFNRLVSIFKHVEQVCIEYDNIKNITKVEEGNHAAKSPPHG